MYSYVPDSIAVCLSSREEMYCLNIVNISSQKGTEFNPILGEASGFEAKSSK